MKERIPEESRDEALKAEMVRLFEESKTEMRTFEKIFILVRKPLDASQTNDWLLTLILFNQILA